MDRCPVCGFELPEGPNRTCYNCLGRENEAKRFGTRRPVSRSTQKKWHARRMAAGKEATLPEKLTQVAEMEQAGAMSPSHLRSVRQGINNLLYAVYRENRQLSDILRAGGVSVNDVRRLQSCCIEEFVVRLIESWRALWTKVLGSGACTLVCRWYALDGRAPADRQQVSRQLHMSESDVMLAIDRAVQTMRLESVCRKMAQGTVEVARDLLAEGCEC